MEKVFLGILANMTKPWVVKAVHGVLDFIYYSHFEVHTNESLAQLDMSWVLFHQNKEVFKELGIRKHFNISKIHNIKHYLDSIRNLGSASGFNTEATEQLHIDFAKLGYHTSNKKEGYTKQMVMWLGRQEALSRFDAYLEWTTRVQAQRGSQLEADSDSEGKGEGDMPDEDKSDMQVEGDGREPTVMYKVAKKPSQPCVTVASIVNNYGADNFLIHLDTFLRGHLIVPPVLLSERSTFPIHQRIRLSLPPIPEVSSTPINDVIIATKAEASVVMNMGIKNTSYGCFSTALVWVEPEDSTKGPLH
ncbi:hypothetical protein DXG01_004079, partial [Tephrocybe rancida]